METFLAEFQVKSAFSSLVLLLQTLSSSTRASRYLDAWFSQIQTALNTLPSRTKTHFCWESVVQYFTVALPPPPPVGGGCTEQSFIRGRSAPRSNPVTLLYTIVDRKGTPFAYLPLKNGTPFTYLLKSTASLF